MVARLVAVIATLSVCCSALADRWSILPDGSGVEWRVAEDPAPAHSDFIEMSGLRVSLDCSFAVASNRTLSLGRKLFWPGFRKQPNNTYGILSASFGHDDAPTLLVTGEGTEIQEVQ